MLNQRGPFRRLGYDDRTSDCFFVLHGSYQAELHSRHAFADLAALRGLPPGEPDDHREVSRRDPNMFAGHWAQRASSFC